MGNPFCMGRRGYVPVPRKFFEAGIALGMQLMLKYYMPVNNQQFIKSEELMKKE